MSQHDHQSGRPGGPNWMAIFPFVFGIALLGFLKLIDRPHWFHIRPMSTAASAMARTGTPAPQAKPVETGRQFPPAPRT